MAGRNRGTLIHCYSSGSVSSGKRAFAVGGFIGDNGGGTIIRSFYDVQASAQSNMCGQGDCDSAAAAKSTSLMKKMSTFSEWDFAIWTLDEDQDYPRLWWENKPGETIPDPLYTGGSGRPDDPYLISSAQLLNRLAWRRCDKSMHFQLAEDIDLSEFTGTKFDVIGKDYLDPFTGVFDGNSKVVSNFLYNTTNYFHKGIFGYVSGRNAEIKNWRITDCNLRIPTGGPLVGMLYEGEISNCIIENVKISGSSTTGGLVGEITFGSVRNCHISVDITANRETGGLAGINSSGTISYCSAEVTINGYFNIGGLVGLNEGIIFQSEAATTFTLGSSSNIGALVGGNSGKIINCRSSGRLENNSSAGGLVGANKIEGRISSSYATTDMISPNGAGLVTLNQGAISQCYATGDSPGAGLVYHNEGTIFHCYSTGQVTGPDSGGLVTKNVHLGTIVDSFWDSQTSGKETGDYGTPKTTAEMKKNKTFTDAGWDFHGETENGLDDFWRMCQDDLDYPHLAWEHIIIGDFLCPDDVGVEDLSFFARHWLQENCSAKNNCSGTDLNHSDTVNLNDFRILAQNWLSSPSI